MKDKLDLKTIKVIKTELQKWVSDTKESAYGTPFAGTLVGDLVIEYLINLEEQK
jgi:hypothetical protein